MIRDDYPRQRYAWLVMLVAAIAVPLGAPAVAADPMTHWLGEDSARRRIEFCSDPDLGLWLHLVDDHPVTWFREAYRTRELIELVDCVRTTKIRIGLTEARIADPGSKEFRRLCRGGWQGSGFRRILKILPGKWHGHWGGNGNIGGMPTDSLDSIYQRHDISYYLSPIGGWDTRPDARLVAESLIAAVNPFNGLSPDIRQKAILGAGVFLMKPGLYRTRPIFGIRIPVPTLGPEKLGYYFAEGTWNKALKPVGKATWNKALKPVGKKIGHRARRIWKKVF